MDDWFKRKLFITLRLSSVETLCERFRNISMTLETGPRDVDASVMDRVRFLSLTPLPLPYEEGTS
jgi:hypothetical protein